MLLCIRRRDSRTWNKKTERPTSARLVDATLNKRFSQYEERRKWTTRIEFEMIKEVREKRLACGKEHPTLASAQVIVPRMYF